MFFFAGRWSFRYFWQSADPGNGTANAGNLSKYFWFFRGLRPESVPRRSPQFDKEPAGLVRRALVQATIPEWKFVPRLRKALRPQQSPAHRLAFPKRSLALPPVRRRPHSRTGSVGKVSSANAATVPAPEQLAHRDRRFIIHGLFIRHSRYHSRGRFIRYGRFI